MIDKIGGEFASFQKISGINGKPSIEPQGGVEKGGFGDFLNNALKEVDTLQQSADKQIENVMLGKPEVTTHEAIIALEKADVAFQLMSQVRAKIIRAYEEVMRTQV